LYLSINHLWRELKARRGWGNGGCFAEFGAGGLTFLAVVVAWVFFRADSLASAEAILAGMAGFNGTLEKWVPVREGLKVILPSLAVVWLFPNVRQIMCSYQPTWDDMAGKETPAPLMSGRLARTLTWRPSRLWALVMAGIFIVCLDSLSKVSEFLYFQF
jgi:hypothetical protein